MARNRGQPRRLPLISPYIEPLGATTNFTTSPQYEYEICFKCHTSFAWGIGAKPATATLTPLTDQASEFNPSNPSYHAVAGASKLPAGQGTFTGGWSATSRMTCSDCHGNDGSTLPQGPHGSTNTPILIKAYNPSTVGQSIANDLCYVCHDSNAYYTNNVPGQTGFNNGVNNLHYRHMQPAPSGVTYQAGTLKACTNCHVNPPHGSNKTRMISYQTDPSPYGQNSYLTRLTLNTGAYVAANCAAVSCHSGSHPQP